MSISCAARGAGLPSEEFARWRRRVLDSRRFGQFLPHLPQGKLRPHLPCTGYCSIQGREQAVAVAGVRLACLLDEIDLPAYVVPPEGGDGLARAAFQADLLLVKNALIHVGVLQNGQYGLCSGILALYIGTVFYEVTRLRRNGERLRFKEWRPPEFGYIRMATWRPGKTAMLRTARVAILRDGSTVLVLIEPKVTYTPFDGQVWEGTELASTPEGTKEVPQAWLVRPRAKDAQPLRPFDLKRWLEYRKASGDVPQPAVGNGWLKPERRH